MNAKLCKKMRKMAKVVAKGYSENAWKVYYKKWKKETKHANAK